MGAFFQELFHFGLYKRSQGRIARQATFAALAVIVTLGCWAFHQHLKGIVSQYPDWSTTNQNLVRFGIPLLLLVAGAWICFRVVQMPAFADFLISVEGEMNKVSWPSRTELFRASLVVMVVIFFLAALLYLYDVALGWLLGQVSDLVKRIFG